MIVGVDVDEVHDQEAGNGDSIVVNLLSVEHNSCKVKPIAEDVQLMLIYGSSK